MPGLLHSGGDGLISIITYIFLLGNHSEQTSEQTYIGEKSVGYLNNRAFFFIKKLASQTGKMRLESDRAMN